METDKLSNVYRSDPWKSKKDSPPDLDEILIKWKNSMFGGKKKNGSGGDDITGFAAGLIMLVLLTLWLASGFFIVEPSENAVILRLGKYHTTMYAGPHWIPRFIDEKHIVNVNKVSQFGYSAQMLTKDENIVDIELSVQYQVDNPKDYLFNVTTPVESIREATASALRQVVGHTGLDDILTTGREIARNQVEDQLIKILDIYKNGIHIVDVNLQPAKPPEQVTEAFDDAIKAREDQQRFINHAQAYMEKVVPLANGNAARLIEEANAYKIKVTLDAKAEVAKFIALLEEHARAPELTDQRLYFDALEHVFSNTSKVLVDTAGSNNILYLPLDKMLDGALTSKDKKEVADVLANTASKDIASSNTANYKRANNRYMKDNLASLRREYEQ